MPALITISILMYSSLSAALTGTIYEKDSGRKKVLYTIESTESESDGIYQREMIFFDTTGKPVVKEWVKLKGTDVISYGAEFPRREEKGLIEVKDKTIHFSYTKDGKTKTAKESLVENFVVGLSMVPYIQSNWDKFISGEEINIRFGVLDRKDTVGLTFIRQKEKENKKGIVLAKMKASSFLIRALVDPLYLYFNEETKELEYFIGRAKPKQLINGKWKDLDAETVYQNE